MMLLAQGFLAVGLVGDAYLTMRMVFDSELLAIVVATVALGTFSTLLYLIPVAARQRSFHLTHIGVS
jgi:hypothetical protein